MLSMVRRNDAYQLDLENMQGAKIPSLKIHENIVGKYTSYLDWLELVYQYNKEKEIDSILSLNIYDKRDLVEKLQKEDLENFDTEKIIKQKAEKVKASELMKEIEKKLEWKYIYMESSKIPTKTSVTKLKELEMDNDIDELIDLARNKGKEHMGLTAKPKFMEEVQKLTAAQKGTLIHLCIQKLDEKIEYSRDDIKEFIEDLCKRNIISEIEAQSINIDILYKYTKSELWQELKNAKEIHKEAPFYINVPASKIYDEAEKSEMILVQGIIDLYYISKEGKLILVDFKTDYVPNGDVSKLEEKYAVQLELYKNALEGVTGKKVDKAMIWALSK